MKSSGNSTSSSSSKTKKKTKKSSAPKLGFMRDERFKKIVGGTIVLISAFLLLSSISFIFTGQHDLHLLLSDPDTIEASERYKNFMGKLGALCGKLLTHDSFGLAGLTIPLILALLGVKVWNGKMLLPLGKTIRLSLWAILFVPVFIGFLFHEADDTTGRIMLTCNDNLVGAFGANLLRWSVFTLGWLGTFFVLFVLLGGVIVINFYKQLQQLGAVPQFIRDFLNKEEELEDGSSADEEDIAKAEKETKTHAEKTDDALSELVGNIQLDPQEEIVEAVQEETMELEVESAVPAPAPIAEAKPLEIETPEVEETEENLEITESAVEETLTEDEIDDKVQQFGEYDPKLDLSRYELPNIDLLVTRGGNKSGQIDTAELEANKNRIVSTLNDYKIEISKIKATIGPTVTLYEIVPAPGVRISKIKNLEDDIALSLAALGIRIIAPIPGKGTIGIEVPNSKPDIVDMRALIASDKFQNADMALPVAIGKTISNETFCFDLAKMPHLLMAGATGQGKSVGLNAILVSLLYKRHPAQLKFVLVDPKKVELTLFNKIERHFLAKLPDEEDPIITDTSKVVKTLNSLCTEMDDRYELLKTAHCRNIKEYNAKFIKRKLNPENGHRYLPYIVLVVDEFADLIMTAGKEVETPIARLAQLARAIGIHLIIATQRPSVNIITGTIKANFPARIAFRVTSKIDSRTILDAGGADQLIGRGDMLMSTGNDLIRLQCGFVDTPEVEEICDFIGAQQGYPSAFLLPEVADDGESEIGHIDAADRDAKFEEAARLIVLHQQGSASLLQRKLKLGYNRAGRIIDQLEAAGIIGPFEGSKARKVLIPDEMSLEQLLNNEA